MSMHIIIEQMFILRYGQQVSAGLRVSCDYGKSWIVRGILSFKRNEVKSFEHHHREITTTEYSRRLVRQHNVILEIVTP